MRLNRLALYAWAVLVYNLLVILWGAYVRASGSGAGCGNHWPLCNGQVIPRPEQVETLIEFTHRLTTGLVMVLVIGLLVWAFRAAPKGHPVRLGAGLSLFFTLMEVLLGAGLVLFHLVADNDSMFRAVVMAVHLVNTFLLLAALTLVAWWASGGPSLRLRGQGLLLWLLGVGWLVTLVLGASGGVTALGDTLFPAGSLAEGLTQDFSPTAHILLRLRVFHPLIAILVGLYLIVVARLVTGQRPSPASRRAMVALVGLFLVQLVVGMLNIRLLAPIWLQLVHLLLADLVWITLVLLTISALAESKPLPEPVGAGPSFSPARVGNPAMDKP